MTDLTAALTNSLATDRRLPPGGLKRWLFLALIAGLVLSSGEALNLAVEALSEAYLAVTVFVAGTLALIYGLERALGTDVGRLLVRYRRWQVPAAAVLGAFPGCGGAIVAITQYTKGHLSFGGVVAALTATMGDAMFLLLAKEPATGALVYVVGIVVGVISGLAVDAIHGPDFMRVRTETYDSCRRGDRPAPSRPLTLLEWGWIALILPGLAIGALQAFQVEVDALIGAFGAYRPSLWLGLAGALLALAMWALRGDGPAGEAGEGAAGTAQRLIADGNFITAWVAFAFLAYELGILLTGIDLARVFAVAAPAVPLIAVLIGFVPGCGPQIVVTTLYLSGAVPLSAQLGNAVSNDGDALFPAIALAPRAALLATLYSAVPALILAYATYFIWEAPAV